jgi:5-histidylcysteine sulfoxide synthase/putative 4-mercaptohistidine N1-methyltranferase
MKTKQLTQQLKTPLLDGSSVEQKRQELREYFKNTWATYESLFALINSDEAYYLRPEPLRHPLIFYFGHTATFYINKLILSKHISQRLDNKLEAICAVGVDEMSWDDLDSTHYDWPSVDEVRVYRTKVYALVLQLIDNMELALPIQQDSLAWIILMGCEHERIHLETSSVIMRMLPLQWLNACEAWRACTQSSSAPENCFISVEQQQIVLGKSEQDKTYGWDNEYGRCAVDVDAFEVSKYLVSNQEYLEFVEAGGYQTPQFWNEEGQAWLKFSQAIMPKFWRKVQQHYLQRNLLSEIPLPLDWPVEVNYLEANAFCAWKQIHSKKHLRLPTEAEWQCLRNNKIPEPFQWTEAPGNTNLEYFASSCPVNKFQQGELFDVQGNVWQWTESPIDAFSGFEVHPFYDDFSTPTFDGKHNIIKGGSWISTGNETLKSSRYAFRRHFFQHAGFRYVASENSTVPIMTMNRFETDIDVCQQLACYYNQQQDHQENYGQQIAQFVQSVANAASIPNLKLLNVGCSVGRVAFELSSSFLKIDAVDFSARYIQFGVQFQQMDNVRYTTSLEGDICQFNEINLTQTVSSAIPERVTFSQGDSCNLKANFTGYDVIILQHALEHSYDPKLLLRDISTRVNSGGLLVILSDYHYTAEKTSKEKWLGGTKVNGENLTGFEALSQQLQPQFSLIAKRDITQVLRVNQRQSQITQCEITAWRLN